jgi:hypothetical protein
MVYLVYPVPALDIDSRIEPRAFKAIMIKIRFDYEGVFRTRS